MLWSACIGTINKEVLLEIFHVLLNVSESSSPCLLSVVFIAVPTPPTQIFESCILSTYQSSHVQFLLFQLSNFDEVSFLYTHTCMTHAYMWTVSSQALQQAFLEYLWNKVLFSWHSLLPYILFPFQFTDVNVPGKGKCLSFFCINLLLCQLSWDSLQWDTWPVTSLGLCLYRQG